MAPREADGSLPNNGFGRLKANSRFIDKGCNQVKGVSKETLKPFIIDFVPGVDYFGPAKDLGAYETDGEVTALPSLGSNTLVFSNYPNPVRHVTQFVIHSQETAVAHLEIVDLSGKSIYRSSLDLMKGECRQISFDASALPAGVYQAVLTQAQQKEVLKIVLEK